jgi:fructose 1,6-bisphosphatase
VHGLEDMEYTTLSLVMKKLAARFQDLAAKDSIGE